MTDAKEIIRRLEFELGALNEEAIGDNAWFERADEIDRLTPGLAYALDLAREVVAKWKEKHGDG